MQNIYYQQPMGPMMSPQAPMPMWQRMMNGVGKIKDAFPKWLSQYSIVIYILALAAVSFMYSANSLPWYFILSGVVSVLAFFLFGSSLAKETSILKRRNVRAYEKQLFKIAFVPRLIVVLMLYFIFQSTYGDAFGFESGDAKFYHDLGVDFADALSNGYFVSQWNEITKALDISDMGYATYVGFLYWLTGKSILVVRLLKCLLSSWIVVLIYRLAKRNFGEQTARMAALFVALWPNFWYYCSAHLKETEMVFLGVLFVEQADQMLRSRQFTAWKIIPILLIAAAMFTVRTPLGIVALLSLVFSVVMSSAKVVSWGKRIIVGILAIVLIGVVAGNRISEEARGLVYTVQSGQQQSNIQWRSERQGGNKLAKYAGASVFAPMIFTFPFPTMVKNEGSPEMPQLLNGGNFVKNIMSCFTIFALIMLLMSGEWREHLLSLSFMLGYLAVLTMSTFAQSERFHQPAMPFEFMFAAYGLSIAVTKKKYKRWFMYWCALILVAAIAWNWFRMKGRGL